MSSENLSSLNINIIDENEGSSAQVNTDGGASSVSLSRQVSKSPRSTQNSIIQITLTDEQREDLHQLFSLLDEDNSGAISIEELSELMSLLGVKFTHEELEMMVCEIDENNDGEIQFEEFLAVMSRRMRAYYHADEVRAAFSVFAGDAPDGCIKLSTLESALCEYGTQKLTPTEAKALLNNLRTDSSGFFSYDDYIEDVYTTYDG